VAGLASIVAGTVRTMGATLRNVFRAGNTIPYPRAKRAIPGQWRAGSFALTFDPKTGEENCIGCRLCEYICPSEIIKVTLRKGEPRANGIGATYCDVFVLDYQACMQCELCLQVCPTDAIVMTRSLAPTAATRDGLLLTKDRLMANGRALLEAPELTSHATPTRIREWTDAARGTAAAAAPAPPAETA
jgi:NADH-quinone oxidoreductase subunit I